MASCGTGRAIPPARHLAVSQRLAPTHPAFLAGRLAANRCGTGCTIPLQSLHLLLHPPFSSFHWGNQRNSAQEAFIPVLCNKLPLTPADSILSNKTTQLLLCHQYSQHQAEQGWECSQIFQHAAIPSNWQLPQPLAHTQHFMAPKCCANISSSASSGSSRRSCALDSFEQSPALPGHHQVSPRC